MAGRFDGNRMESFAGYRITDPRAADPDYVATRARSAELSLSEQERAAEESYESRSVFDTAKKELMSAGQADTAAGSALSYAGAVANIKSLVQNREFEAARQAYEAMDSNAKNHRVSYLMYSGARPTSSLDRGVQVGSEMYAKRAFDLETVNLGDERGDMTLGWMFGKGGYKELEGDAVITDGFSNGFSTVYKDSSDPDRQSMARMIAAPILRSGSQTPHPARLQIADVGNYFVKNYDGLVNDLGIDGARRLLDDAVNVRSRTGTSIDIISAVRKTVAAMGDADPGIDRASAVGSVLRQYDRMLTGTTVPGGNPTPSDSASRLVTQMIGAAVDATDGKIDFDDLTVRGVFDGLLKTYARADRMGINLTALAAGNADVKSGLAEAFQAASEHQAVPESNAFSNVELCMDAAADVLSGGCVPANVPASAKSSDPRVAVGSPTAALGYTTGSGAFDGALGRMWKTLSGEFLIPNGFRGTRADIALADVVSNDETRSALVDGWTDDLMSAFGLTDRTASEVASRLVGSMVTERGQVVPVDLRETMNSMAHNEEVPGDVRSELMVLYKAFNMIGDVVADDERGYAAMLMDKKTGFGLDDELSVASAQADARKTAAVIMSKGHDPHAMYQKLIRTRFYYTPTGNFMTPDGSVVKPDANGRVKITTADGRSRTTDPVTAGCRPEIIKSDRPVDLNKVTVRPLRFGPLVVSGLPEGSYQVHEDEFRKNQNTLAGLYEENIRMVRKYAEQFSGAVAKANASEMSSD